MKHLRSNLSSLSPRIAKQFSFTLIASFAIGAVLLLAASTVSAQNIISTYAGSSPTGGAALTVDLPGPTAAIRDSSGNTYIAAPYSTDVFDLNNGTVSVFAGLGYGGFGGDGGPASASILALPSGLAFDGKGNIYIVDPGNSRVRMATFNGTTWNISTFAGTGKKCEPTTATCGDGGPASGKNSSAEFNLPMGIAFDNAGNAYIADSFDNRIRKVDTSGILTTYVGTGVACPNPTQSCGDGGSPTAAQLYYPEGVAVDSAGNLYIADTRDNRIRMVTPPGANQTISTVVGKGAICNIPTGTNACGDNGLAANATMHFPTSVVLDSSNNIYIADSLDFRLRAVNMQASNSITVFGVAIKPNDIATVAGNGTQGNSGNGSPATGAELNLPNSVFLDSAGNLVLSDLGNQVIRQITPAGIISVVAGGGLGDGPTSSATLANPFNVAEDSAGNLYIADTANNRIREVPVGGGSITTFAGTGAAGFSGDNGAATAATLTGPTGIAFDSSGNAYIADAGNLRIRRVDAASKTITTYAGNGKSCKPNQGCGDGGAATSATFSTPQAVAVDSAGNVYIVDYTENRVRVVDTSVNHIINNFAGSGNTGLYCVPNNSGSVQATKANLNHPSGITIDSANNVYIDDSYSDEICVVTNGVLSRYALSGAGKFGGDGGPALDGSQWNPLEVSIDPSGDLFIGGGNNSCIRRVDAFDVTYTIGTVAGDAPDRCVGGFAGDGGPAVSNKVKIAPQGLVVDGNSNLYIADNNNDRIRYVHLTPAVTLTPPQTLSFGAWEIGQTSTTATLTIESSGGEDLSLISLGPIGGLDAAEFTETGTTCGSTFPVPMGVDTTCTVSFTFTPKTYGLRTATFTITDNDPTGSQTITLSGDGPYFSVTAVPPTLTINPGSSGSTTLTLTTYAGFNNPVTYSVTSCPSNYFSSCTLTPVGQNATLTITVNGGISGTTQTVQAKGTWEALQSWVNIKVTIP